HLKIVFNNDTQSPEVYIDGEHVTHYNESSNDENRIKAGKIGLYAYNTGVTIDNIVVSGKRITDADDVDSIELLSSAYNADTKEISAKIKVSTTDAANKDVYMAFYSKNDNRLINVSAVTSIGSGLASFERDIKLENVENYNNEDYRVSIFVWDTQTMEPVDGRIDL
ncbi:MAG: hypothetical protein PUE27_00295, partial [Sharpea porci]|uniref:hypothetical protein n=1 Tax=Sharpea porci TaxID=2652286 RepID=UPI00240A29EB